jgi:hypothetical protein
VGGGVRRCIRRRRDLPRAQKECCDAEPRPRSGGFMYIQILLGRKGICFGNMYHVFVAILHLGTAGELQSKLFKPIESNGLSTWSSIRPPPPTTGLPQQHTQHPALHQQSHGYCQVAPRVDNGSSSPQRARPMVCLAVHERHRLNRQKDCRILHTPPRRMYNMGKLQYRRISMLASLRLE